MEQELTLGINGMSCAHCVRHVAQALQALEGVTVQEVRVGAATVKFDPSRVEMRAIAEAIERAGYSVAKA
jgi:copper chaperone CopZ